MKQWLVILSMIFISSALNAGVFAESANKSHKDSIYAKTGFTRGGIAFGVAWERNASRNWSAGAYVHQQSEDAQNGGIGATAVGAMFGAHFFKRGWDLYIQPGFGMVMADNGADKETAIGPSMIMGLKFQKSKTLSFGLERGSYHGWFATDFKGQIAEVIMATIHIGL